jgi:4-amino-4-deoxy-L-arabinose transferase-like glycosyltransferase
MDDVRPGRSDDAAPIRWLVVAALVGLLARLAFGLGYWTGEPLTRDEQEYLSLARSLVRGQGFVYDDVLTSTGVEPFGRAPGYPAFLALAGGGGQASTSVPTAVKIAQAIVGAFGVVMVGLIAQRLAGPRAAILAAAGAAVYPPLVWIAGYALSEALFWPVGLLTAWLFDRALARPAAARAALACGLALGAGTLIRPALVVFLPLAGLLLIARRRPLTLAVMTLGMMIVVGPWTVRNYLHHGRLVFVASEGGVTFWTGNHPLAVGDGDMAANIGIKLDNQRLRAAHPGVGEEEMEPVYYREALRWIREHPTDWLALQARKVFYLIVPVGPSYTLHSTRYYVLSVVSYGTVLILTLVTIGRLRRLLPRVAGLWLLAASAIIVSLVFFPQERFRIPILDPSLVILAGAGLALSRRVRPS